MRRFRLMFMFVALTTMLSCGVAAGAGLTLGLSAHADVEAGLDPATRELIARMPEEIKNQTLDLLAKALPMLDTSVYAYLGRINEVLDHQVVHASCVLVGTGHAVISDIKHSLLGGTPTPVADLRKQSDGLQTAFHRDSTPRDYVTGYADFLAQAEFTACSVESSPPAFATVQDLASRARLAWTVWRRLDGQCADADSCVRYAGALAARTIAAADPRDLATTDARSRYAQIQAPVAPGWTLTSLFRRYRQQPAEETVMAYLQVVDAISLSLLSREIKADDQLQKARDLLSEATTQIDNANAHLREPYQCYVQARKQIEAIVPNWALIDERLQAARRLAPERHEEAESIDAQAMLANARATQIRKAAADYVTRKHCGFADFDCFIRCPLT